MSSELLVLILSLLLGHLESIFPETHSEGIGDLSKYPFSMLGTDLIFGEPVIAVISAHFLWSQLFRLDWCWCLAGKVVTTSTSTLVINLGPLISATVKAQKLSKLEFSVHSLLRQRFGIQSRKKTAVVLQVSVVVLIQGEICLVCLHQRRKIDA